MRQGCSHVWDGQRILCLKGRHFLTMTNKGCPLTDWPVEWGKIHTVVGCSKLLVHQCIYINQQLQHGIQHEIQHIKLWSLWCMATGTRANLGVMNSKVHHSSDIHSGTQINQSTLGMRMLCRAKLVVVRTYVLALEKVPIKLTLSISTESNTSESFEQVVNSQKREIPCREEKERETETERKAITEGVTNTNKTKHSCNNHHPFSLSHQKNTAPASTINHTSLKTNPSQTRGANNHHVLAHSATSPSQFSRFSTQLYHNNPLMLHTR